MSFSRSIIRASRPNFLVLAPLCVLLGVAMAWQQQGGVQRHEVGLVVLGGLLAHAGVNLLNEFDDFRSGLDLITTRTPFSGGSGALPAEPGAAPLVGWWAMVALFGMGMIGIYFLWQRGWPILIIGVAGLALVIGYTRWITRFPWWCLLAPGLGFGPLMVLGSFLALGGVVDATALVAATIVLLLVSELLLINQLPDVEADRRVGRRHLPIVLGLAAAAQWVAGLLVGAYLLLAQGILMSWLPDSAWLAMLPLPAALWVAGRLPAALDDSAALPRVLGVNVATLLCTLALLGVALGLK